MNLKLEAIVIPVSDVDRAKKFYREALGFRVDVDHRAAVYEQALGFRHRSEASYRIVRLTPPGSECSIQIGTGITRVKPAHIRECTWSCPISRPPGPSSSTAESM